MSEEDTRRVTAGELESLSELIQRYSERARSSGQRIYWMVLSSAAESLSDAIEMAAENDGEFCDD